MLTADAPTMRSAFREMEVALAEPGNPESVARGVRRLLADPAAHGAMARAGHERYRAEHSEGPLSRRLDGELQSIQR